MFWNRNKNRKQRKYTNYNWIIVGLILIALLNHYDGNRVLTQAVDGDTVPETPTATTTANPLKSLRIPTGKDFKLFQQRIFPDPSKRIVTIQDLEAGEGAPAVCGQKVRLVYQAYDERGEMLPASASSKKPLEFTIGHGKQLPAFEQGIIGMRPGGVRNILSPPKLAYGADGFKRKNIPANSNVRFEVKLLEARPNLPAPESSSFRFFDTNRGLGTPIRCGQTVPLHITIWSTSGKKLYTSFDVGAQPIPVTPGSGEQFLGLEHAAIDMRPGMSRTAIVPPAFQKVWHKGENTLPIKFPEDETVLVDIQAIR